VAISSGTGSRLEGRPEFRDPDVRLMLRVRDDEPGAFEALVELYQHRLVGVLAHLVGRREDAEDLAQEVFLRVYRSRKRYRPRAKFATWIFTIANNLSSNFRRRTGRTHAVSLEGGRGAGESGTGPAAGLVGSEPTASTQLRRIELADVVREALCQLNEDQRLAVLLNKFEGLSYAEIAQVMRRSEAAVKSLLARARWNLREQLEPYLCTGQLASQQRDGAVRTQREERPPWPVA
jgi:RNA polymerase sigma-70 factor (ECF subfamily)